MESVMEAPTEQAPAMTLREAEEVIQRWQANLQQEPSGGGRKL
jgi:hypothetical protein